MLISPRLVETVFTLAGFIEEKSLAAVPASLLGTFSMIVPREVTFSTEVRFPYTRSYAVAALFSTIWGPCCSGIGLTVVVPLIGPLFSCPGTAIGFTGSPGHTGISEPKTSFSEGKGGGVVTCTTSPGLPGSVVSFPDTIPMKFEAQVPTVSDAADIPTNAAVPTYMAPSFICTAM